MNQTELTQIVVKSMQDLGFARIKRAVLASVFDDGSEAISIAQNHLESYAKSNGWEFKHEAGDFVVFYKEGTEPPQIPL